MSGWPPCSDRGGRRLRAGRAASGRALSWRALSRRALSRPVGALLLALGLLAGSAPAAAHKASDAYLDLRTDGDRTAARWDIALRDLDLLVDLDGDGDGDIRWREIEQQQAAIDRLVASTLAFARGDVACATTPPTRQIARRGDGAYLALRFEIRCPDRAPPQAFRYRLLADIDPTHRVVVSGAGSRSLDVVGPSQAFRPLAGTGPGDARGVGADLLAFGADGFRHILNGPDHLAFLIALLVAAFAAPGRSSTARDAAPGTLGALLITVSVFTVAHSLTLALTATGRIVVGSYWVEAAVALSVAIAGLQAAIAALLGRSHRFAAVPPWLVFAFGLVHGIGFGASLGESGLTGRSALSALFGFNLGVEVGQLAVIAAALPLIAVLIAMPRVRRWGFAGAGFAIAAAGFGWLVTRLAG